MPAPSRKPNRVDANLTTILIAAIGAGLYMAWAIGAADLANSTGLRILCTLVAVASCAPGVRAQVYSSVVVFGDSLSDSGNVAGILPGAAAGNGFTTNPDPVWAEIVAETFGVPGTHALAGGSNYAIGGTCVDPDASCNFPAPKLGRQVDAHLLQRGSEGADANALYGVWAGLNDIDTIVNPDADIPQADPRTAIPASARALVDQIRRLQHGGARHILVFSLPDRGPTPGVRMAALDNPHLPAALARATTLYNEHLDAGIRTLDDGIVPVNAHALLTEVLDDPARHGFANVLDPACSPVGPNLGAVACGPSDSGSLLTYPPGANRSHLFADLSHPTGAAHAMLASVVTSILAAPVQVSLAGEAGVEAAYGHRRAVSAERLAEFGLERPVGSWRSYATGRVGRRGVDALPRLGAARTDVRATTLGASHRARADLWWGAAVSVGRHENGVPHANVDSDTVVGSVHGTWRQGSFHLSGALNLGTSSMDVERSIPLGSSVRTEHGSTAADQFGVDIELGWTLEGREGPRHGVVLGLSWLDQEVDDYGERERSSTSMHFSDIDRDSLVLRGGYRIEANAQSHRMAIRPYIAIAYERELNDDPISVTAGSNTMAGRFRASGFRPPGQWVGADAGVLVGLGGRVSALVGYSGRFGDRSREDHLVNVGLRIAF